MPLSSYSRLFGIACLTLSPIVAHAQDPVKDIRESIKIEEAADVFNRVFQARKEHPNESLAPETFFVKVRPAVLGIHPDSGTSFYDNRKKELIVLAGVTPTISMRLLDYPLPVYALPITVQDEWKEGEPFETTYASSPGIKAKNRRLFETSRIVNVVNYKGFSDRAVDPNKHRFAVSITRNPAEAEDIRKNAIIVLKMRTLRSGRIREETSKREPTLARWVETTSVFQSIDAEVEAILLVDTRTNEVIARVTPTPLTKE